MVSVEDVILVAIGSLLIAFAVLFAMWFWLIYWEPERLSHKFREWRARRRRYG